MSDSQLVLNEAVVFFNGNKITKTMLYSEFEAVLDGMTGIEDYAGENIKAAYVTVDNGLCLRSCAFFKLRFENNGLADRNWNMPLRHLAEVAGPGPDMGAGRINLACKSQCPVTWHTEQMWDPDMSTSASHLSVLQKTLKTNPMQFVIYEDHVENVNTAKSKGIQANDNNFSGKSNELQTSSFDNIKPTLSRNSEQDAVSVPRINNIVSEVRADSEEASISQDERIRLAGTIKKQRLHINILKTSKDEEIAKLKFQIQAKSLENRSELTVAKGQLELLQAQGNALKEQIKAQASQIEAHNLLSNDRLRIAEEDKNSQLELLQSQLETNFKLKESEQKSQFNKKLRIKAVELSTAKESCEEMESELSKLRNQKLEVGATNTSEEISKLKLQLKTRISDKEKDLRELKGKIEILTAQDDASKDQIKTLKSTIEAQDVAANDRLIAANEDKKDQLELLRVQLEEQYKHKEGEQITHLSEQLQLIEVDLMYQNEISEQMEKELTQLRSKNVHVLDSGEESILNKMQDLGLNFIAFHPGAGHVSIPLDDMNKYMENPMAYIAAKCYVTEKQYKLWLSHYENPFCMYHTVSGDKCTKRIALTSLPSKFVEGENDRCQDHKLSGQNTNVSILVQRS